MFKRSILHFTSLMLLILSLVSCSTNNERGFNGVPINHYLSASLYGMTHFDPAQTDSIPYDVAQGTYHFDLNKVPAVVGGPINILTLASTDKNHFWGVSSQGVTYIDTTNGELKEIARYNYPGQKVITEQMHDAVLNREYKTASEVDESVAKNWGLDILRGYSGVYSLVDKDNNVYVTALLHYIFVVTLVDPSDPSKGIKAIKQYDTSKILAPHEGVAGLSMTYDGKLVILGNKSVTVINKDFTGTPSQIRFADNELVTNAIAIDSKNGIYVASDKFMRKIVWTGSKLSMDEKDGAWKASYPGGDEMPVIKVGTGTGSTPTLMGFGKDEDKLVVITDGEDQMKLVAFWRDEIPSYAKAVQGESSKRIAGEIAITCGLDTTQHKYIQSEQSVVVKGYGAFVVNNMPLAPASEFPKNKLSGLIALGPVIPASQGAERVEWNPQTHEWKSVWTRPDVSSTSMVPIVSVPSNMALINGYGIEGWEVTGLDWNTGKTVHRSIFGKNNKGNGAYAIIQFLPNGDLLFNSISGPHRLTYNK